MNISVVDDFIFEDEESFVISLEVEHSSGVSVHIRQTTVTILDNDQVLISLTANQTTLAEDAGALDLCVHLTGQTEKNVTYQIEITPVEGWFSAAIFLPSLLCETPYLQQFWGPIFSSPLTP